MASLWSVWHGSMLRRLFCVAYACGDTARPKPASCAMTGILRMASKCQNALWSRPLFAMQKQVWGIKPDVMSGLETSVEGEFGDQIGSCGMCSWLACPINKPLSLLLFSFTKGTIQCFQLRDQIGLELSRQTL